MAKNYQSIEMTTPCHVRIILYVDLRKIVHRYFVVFVLTKIYKLYNYWQIFEHE